MGKKTQIFTQKTTWWCSGEDQQEHLSFTEGIQQTGNRRIRASSTAAGFCFVCCEELGESHCSSDTCNQFLCDKTDRSVIHFSFGPTTRRQLRLWSVRRFHFTHTSFSFSFLFFLLEICVFCSKEKQRLNERNKPPKKRGKKRNKQ